MLVWFSTILAGRERPGDFRRSLEFSRLTVLVMILPFRSPELESFIVVGRNSRPESALISRTVLAGSIAWHEEYYFVKR
jgi:hypothetical protein